MQAVDFQGSRVSPLPASPLPFSPSLPACLCLLGILLIPLLHALLGVMQVLPPRVQLLKLSKFVQEEISCAAGRGSVFISLALWRFWLRNTLTSVCFLNILRFSQSSCLFILGCGTSLSGLEELRLCVKLFWCGSRICTHLFSMG